MQVVAVSAGSAGFPLILTAPPAPAFPPTPSLSIHCGPKEEVEEEEEEEEEGHLFLAFVCFTSDSISRLIIPDVRFSRTLKMLKRSEQHEVKNTNRLDRLIPRDVSHNPAVDKGEKLTAQIV